jgi:hypothetical protein
MAKQQTYKIGPIEATMSTKTGAREEAERRAAKALGGSYEPFYGTLGDARLFVWREPESGWTYKIVHPGDAEGGDLSGCVAFGGDVSRDRWYVIASATLHMLDLYWDRRDETFPAWADGQARLEILDRDRVASMPAPHMQSA